MKQLPKRDGIERPRIHRSRLGTVGMLRASLHQGIADLLADMGETEDCRLQIVTNPRTGKPRLGVLPIRKPSGPAPERKS